MKTLVVSHVTLVMSQLIVTLGPVKIMVAGVVVMLRVAEVSTWVLMCILMIIFIYENQIQVTVTMIKKYYRGTLSKQ